MEIRTVWNARNFTNLSCRNENEKLEMASKVKNLKVWRLGTLEVFRSLKVEKAWKSLHGREWQYWNLGRWENWKVLFEKLRISATRTLPQVSTLEPSLSRSDPARWSQSGYQETGKANQVPGPGSQVRGHQDWALGPGRDSVQQGKDNRESVKHQMCVHRHIHPPILSE